MIELDVSVAAEKSLVYQLRDLPNRHILVALLVDVGQKPLALLR